MTLESTERAAKKVADFTDTAARVTALFAELGEATARAAEQLAVGLEQFNAKWRELQEDTDVEA